MGDVSEYALSVIHTGPPLGTATSSALGSGGGGGGSPLKTSLSRARPGRAISASMAHSSILGLILLVRRDIFGVIELLARKEIAARARFDTLPRFR